jgi:O-antigen/teichoic acid export membrane protein
MLRILAMMFPFAALSQVISGYVLIPLRFDRLVSIASLVGAVATVALTFGLGVPFGGWGVASARVLGYIVMSAFLLEVLRRQGLTRRLFSA